MIVLLYCGFDIIKYLNILILNQFENHVPYLAQCILIGHFILLFLFVFTQIYLSHLLCQLAEPILSHTVFNRGNIILWINEKLYIIN